MGLRELGERLPPGFRFNPSDEELVCEYLYKKVANQHVPMGTLIDIDLHTCEPWQLPEAAKINRNEWYFFSFRDRKYSTGYRTNRATLSGYWKATGKDRTVLDPKTNAIIGMRKTLVFYKNRAPNGVKTGWIMHEFRLENPLIPPKEDWVLCKVFYKANAKNSYGVLEPQNIYDNTSPNYMDDTSPPFAASCRRPPPPCGHHHRMTTYSSQDQSQNFLELSSQPSDNPNFLIKESTDQMIDVNKFEDQYGFFFDMGFEDDVPSHQLDMRFDEL